MGCPFVMREFIQLKNLSCWKSPGVGLKGDNYNRTTTIIIITTTTIADITNTTNSLVLNFASVQEYSQFFQCSLVATRWPNGSPCICTHYCGATNSTPLLGLLLSPSPFPILHSSLSSPIPKCTGASWQYNLTARSSHHMSFGTMALCWLLLGLALELHLYFHDKNAL